MLSLVITYSLRTQTYFQLSHLSGGEKRLPEIRLCSQANSPVEIEGTTVEAGNSGKKKKEEEIRIFAHLVLIISQTL